MVVRRSSRAASVRARREVREVGADVTAAAGVPRIVWQLGAAGLEEDAAPALAPTASPARARASPCSRASAERGGRLGDDRRAPCARAGGRRTPRTARGRRPARSASSRTRFVRPGDQVDLAVQLRASRSCGSRRRSCRRRRRGTPDGDVDLVRGDGRRARVAHLPPPLVADHARPSARVEPRARRRRRAHDERCRTRRRAREQDDRHDDPEDHDERGPGAARRRRTAAPRGCAGPSRAGAARRRRRSRSPHPAITHHQRCAIACSERLFGSSSVLVSAAPCCHECDGERRCDERAGSPEDAGRVRARAIPEAVCDKP